MKRFVLLLLLAVLLAGCNRNQPETTQPSDVLTETTQPTEPQALGIYDPNSGMEEKTFGAISAYLPGEQLSGMAVMGERLVAASSGEGDAVKLTVYEGVECVPIYSAFVTDTFRLDGAAVNITDSSISYYDDENNEAVLMGADLLERERVVLPEDMVGEPAIASDFSLVYYSTGSEIRVLDIKTGIVRLLRTMADQQVQMRSICFQNTVLVCQVTEAEESYTAFLSAETGETLGFDESLLSFSAQGNDYFLQRKNASVVEQLYGTYKAETRMLNPAVVDYECYGIVEMPAALTTAVVADRGLSLGLYDLTSGKRTASVLLPDVWSISAVVADGTGENLWILTTDSQENSIIYRWELAQSDMHNEQDYTSVRFTRENPDTEGIADCQARADEIGQKFGVDILLSEEEMVMSPNYTMTAEYQVRALKKGLSALEAALSRFPDGFFKTMAGVTSDGVLHISIVQSINSNGSEPGPAGMRYWVGNQEYIAMMVHDDMEQGLYHEICHALDSFLMANSGVLDTWEDLNPDDFQYDYNYDAYLEREESIYLEGESRAFVDAYSMSYPKEDRARVFEYAMTGGNEEYFASQTMQAKLKLLCKAIRDAYCWKEDPRVFPWEQYLKE